MTDAIDHDLARVQARELTETIEAWVTRNRAASLHAFALEFRKRIGQPMDESEWLLAKLAHSYGWHDVLDAALRDVDLIPEPAGPEPGAEG